MFFWLYREFCSSDSLFLVWSIGGSNINSILSGDESEFPKISVIVPHFGDPNTPLKLIASLLRQEAVCLQIIVVDDASPLPFKDREGVAVIRRTNNGGFGAAVNSGAKAAIHPLLLVLNSDLSINDSFIAELEAAAKPWQPAICSPQLHDHKGSSQWIGRHFPNVRQQVFEWLTPLARFREKLHESVGHNTQCVDGVVVPVDWVVGAVMLMPTAVFNNAGGFDESFHMNCEEVDLQRRLRADGIPSVFLGTVTATHTGGGSSPSAKRRRWLVDSRFRYAAKWGNPRLLHTSLLLASTVNFAANCVRQTLRRNIDAPSVFREELSYLQQEKP